MEKTQKKSLPPEFFEISANQNEALESAIFIFGKKLNGNSPTVAKLLNDPQEAAFWFHLLVSMPRVFDRRISTAAVGFRNGKMTLMANPEFMETLTPMGRQAVMLHEACHVMFDHFTRFPYKNIADVPESKKAVKGESLQSMHGRFNIAADAAINQYIPYFSSPDFTVEFTAACNAAEEAQIRLGGGVFEPKQKDEKKPEKEQPRNGISVEGLEAAHKIKYRRFDTANYYYDMITEWMRRNPDQTKWTTFYTIDDHDEANGDKLSDAERDAIIGKALNDAVKSCRNAGKIPGHLAEILERLNNPRVPWQQVLSQFMAAASETFTTRTFMKPHRKYGMLLMGHRKQEKLNLVVCVDTSGSCFSAEIQAKFWSELGAMTSDKVTVNVVECDTQVQASYIFKKGQKVNFRGGGGTLYQPGFNEAKRLKADACIYLGDMDSADNPDKPKFPVLWVTVGSSKPPASFGRIISID